MICTVECGLIPTPGTLDLQQEYEQHILLCQGALDTADMILLPQLKQTRAL